jgi:hypothetical protein
MERRFLGHEDLLAVLHDLAPDERALHERQRWIAIDGEHIQGMRRPLGQLNRHLPCGLGVRARDVPVL